MWIRWERTRPELRSMGESICVQWIPQILKSLLLIISYEEDLFVPKLSVTLVTVALMC